MAVRGSQITSKLHDYTRWRSCGSTPPLTDEEQVYMDELWQKKFYLEDVERDFREV